MIAISHRAKITLFSEEGQVLSTCSNRYKAMKTQINMLEREIGKWAAPAYDPLVSQ